MNIKSKKGYIGIDIAVAVIVLFIFVSILAFVSYGFNSSSKEIELKSMAINLALEEIEHLKNMKIETVERQAINQQEMIEEGFYKTIKVEDYADIDPEKTRGLVKKVTVEIRYMFKAKEQKVELTTIVSKEN